MISATKFTQPASKAARHFAGIRLLSSSPIVAAEKNANSSRPKVDRTQSMAFTKKEAGSKRTRSGTSTSVNLSAANPAYYTDPPKPKLDLLSKDTATASRLNTFMQIDDGFLQNTGKGRYPGHLAADFKLFGKPALLYRQVTQTLVDQMAQNAEMAPKRATVLDGQNGAGKSAELLKLATVAATSGHIVIYALSTLPWVNSSRPYGPGYKSDLFVQHELVNELLRSVVAVSRDALNKVPLGKSVTLGKKTLESGKTLADLIDLGLQTPSLAHDALDQLLDIARTQTVVPVFIGLDEVNTLWCQTSYRDQEDNILPANRFRLARSFLPFFEGQSLAKGWVVGATSYAEVRFMPKDLKTKLNPPTAIPIANPDLVRDPGVGELSFDVLKVERLSSAEAWGLMQFYQKANIVTTPVTEGLVAKKWVYANGNPRQMFAGVTTYF
ncbi:hypothetical protein GGI17_005563 [Coemansia sp. S146]|nr:hypothetical protein GGI17_005563 [Coemansia sp. S146]